ncbi:MAG: S-adenosylmethionine:tRNA ribosyltransferase-isomerase, partial [Bdellovibrio sp.]
ACEDPFQEITKFQLLKAVSPGDAFVINVSRVEKRRVFSVEGFEILFVKKKDEKGVVWEVLFPARKAKEGQAFQLPGGVKAILLRKGMPQVMEVSKPLSPQYFDRHGEMALPPYIQKQRSQRHTCREDSQWYQTAWGREWGSCASPTASLHFQKEDLE